LSVPVAVREKFELQTDEGEDDGTISRVEGVTTVNVTGVLADSVVPQTEAT
jgi:hypothetical protein